MFDPRAALIFQTGIKRTLANAIIVAKCRHLVIVNPTIDHWPAYNTFDETDIFKRKDGSGGPKAVRIEESMADVQERVLSQEELLKLYQ